MHPKAGMIYKLLIQFINNFIYLYLIDFTLFQIQHSLVAINLLQAKFGLL